MEEGAFLRDLKKQFFVNVCELAMQKFYFFTRSFYIVQFSKIKII